MPGYNHYSWCLCGWCYHHGRGGYSPIDRAQLERGFQRWSAARFLKAEGADRSFTACLVVPNARCPVCDAAVFFYANHSGARVYFDELGWPWPKHPCTDRPRARIGDEAAPPPLAIRARGSRIEIADAVGLTESSPAQGYADRYGQAPWDMFVVTLSLRLGFLNLLQARPVSPASDEAAYFEFTSAKVSPKENEYFSFKDNTISILDGSLTAKKFQAKTISSHRFETVLAQIGCN